MNSGDLVVVELFPPPASVAVSGTVLAEIAEVEDLFGSVVVKIQQLCKNLVFLVDYLVV